MRAHPVERPYASCFSLVADTSQRTGIPAALTRVRSNPYGGRGLFINGGSLAGEPFKLVHELGHCWGLPHTWDLAPPGTRLKSEGTNAPFPHVGEGAALVIAHPSTGTLEHALAFEDARRSHA